MLSAYSPILRIGRNERQVIQSFGGFRNFQDTDRALELHPIFVVTESDDLGQLPIYEEASDRVYVDLPEYLGDKSTKHTEAVNRTLRTFSSREQFYRNHSDQIPNPMISGFPDHPVEYGIHISIQRALENHYSRIGHRLMVNSEGEGFTERQKSDLQRLAETARPEDDIIMFDVVDVKKAASTPVEEKLRYLGDQFAQYETGVLNAFDPLQGQTENLTPGLAERIGCSMFGDFAIDRRYPPEGGGRPNSISVPHYHPNQQRVAIFEGDDYADAGAQLIEWDEWNPDHCPFCRDIASMVEQGIGQDFGRGKRNRQGHYIETVLRGNI